MMNEAEVKETLGITDFRYISKAKVMQLASLIPNMDYVTQRKIIEQFPEFASLASSTVNDTTQTADAIISENHFSTSEFYNASKKVLDSYTEQIRSDQTSSQDKKYYAEKSMQLLQSMSAKDSENKVFLGKVFGTVATVVAGVAVIAGTILGVTYTGNSVPGFTGKTKQLSDNIDTDSQ